MILKKLKIHGFRSYVDTEINFDDLKSNTTVITGNNGAGKSSLLEALTTVLFWSNSCTDSKGAGMDSCINSNSDYMELTLEFEMNNIQYKINTRKERDESRTLQFFINGIDQSEKVTETQEKINSIIKLSADSFKDTVAIMQGQSNTFMGKTAAERKEIFSHILNLKKYDLYEQEAKDRKKELKTKLSELEYQLELCSVLVSKETYEQELTEITKEFQNNEIQINNLSNKLKEIIEQKAQYNELVKRTQMIINTRSRLKSKKDNLEFDISSLKDYLSSLTLINEDKLLKEKDDLTIKVDKIKIKLDELKEEYAGIKTKNNFYQQEINTLKQKYQKLHDFNESICSVCYSVITVEHKEKHLQDFLNQINEKHTIINSNVEQMNKLSTTINQGIKYGKDFSERISEINNILNTNKLTLQEIDSTKKLLNSKQEDLNSIINEYNDNISIDVSIPEQKQFNDNELEFEISKLRNTQTAINRRITQIEIELKSIDEKQLKEKDLKKQIKALKEEQSDLNAVTSMFGKSGIKSLIIGRDLPLLEKEVNEITNILSDGQLSINFITQTEVGKGKTKHSVDTLNIVINDIHGSRLYNTYSGGERFKIDFALHIALAKFVAKRANAAIDFVFVDEGLGSQDEASKQKFIDIINKLSLFFKQVFVISHIEDIKNCFDSRIIIEKDVTTGSTINII